MEACFTDVEKYAKDPRQYFVELWKAVEQQYNLQITIHDHTGSLLLSDGKMLRPQGNIHRCAYCTFNRQHRSKDCIDHCHWAVMREAARRGEPFVSCCYAGAVELVLPLMRRGEHVATIFAGTFRDRELEIPASWQEHQKNLYLAMNVWRQSSVPALLRTLEQFGAAALAFADNERFSAKNQSDRRGEIEEFFQRNAGTPDITLNDLAEQLGLSASRTSHVLKELFQQSFNALLNSARIRRACDMLSSTQLTIRHIAVLSGFSNEYYFNRVFKQNTKLPPGAYRKRFYQETANASEDKNI